MDGRVNIVVSVVVDEYNSAVEQQRIQDQIPDLKAVHNLGIWQDQVENHLVCNTGQDTVKESASSGLLARLVPKGLVPKARNLPNTKWQAALRWVRRPRRNRFRRNRSGPFSAKPAERVRNKAGYVLLGVLSLSRRSNRTNQSWFRVLGL
eukprot:1183558-Prorocentrum_minimum.AAC.1